LNVNVVEVLGITTFILLLVTALFGMRIIKIDAKIRRKIHVAMAVTAICAAALHGGTVLYLKFFM